MYNLKPFITALQFLTIIPVGESANCLNADQVSDREETEKVNQCLGQSLLYYPLVGLCIGFLLVLLSLSLAHAPETISAALLLSGWVLITGAMHLDGFADCADAWVGGLGDPEKTLKIMKDVYCGPVAVVAVLLLLLIKFVTLQHILSTNNWLVLLVIPMLSRGSVIILFLTTPYVRKDGIGKPMVDNLPRSNGALSLIAYIVVALSIMGWQSLWLLAVLLAVVLLVRQHTIHRIGGVTGDVIGAVIEISEVMLLTTASLFFV